MKRTQAVLANTQMMRPSVASASLQWSHTAAATFRNCRGVSTSASGPAKSSSPASASAQQSAVAAKTATTTTSSGANRKERKLASVFNYIATHASDTVAGGGDDELQRLLPPATVDFVRSITDDERKEALGFFTAKEVAFLASSVATPNLPAEDQPEFAFVGRSNVGKSSLLNALMTRNLARTSNTPGRTQTINYYQAGEIKLVDLPGYGYAKAPVSIVREWQQFVNTFLATRKALYGTSVLIDSRRGVMEKDLEVIQMLNTHALPHQVVLTKADKLARKEIFQVLSETRHSLKRYPFCSPIIHITSKDGLGVDELRIALMRAAKSNQSS